ncbi:Succinyl-CoA ligase (ADP-forming) subunit beta [Rhodothermus marinus SG0.5JP17-172]|jgi:succinyl-CoA synthetase beta subunit|uniref:ADP-forming succinate--CoA ligase subunit beta n=1 Tax=Rhodothermus marinus TaxID=29549 RepID=UPI000223DA7C|nr:ADP-forming succinate--CoA ligase subunit beta [Rhodothermus marinus]AEN73021.1 Succinyl-CoA ligase (ADP-forming) subunit beta [Rhodothermus marinus SG0.5JP17-172]MBO2492244.1 ADP-forming succinate--CoA ligase subunit beta [Rhodothermus marinus]
MKLHEYQAKDILQRYGVATQPGYVARTVEEAVEAARRLQQEQGYELFVVKAQIHAGGRGKGGGVKLAKGIEEVREKAGAILGMNLVTPQTGPEGQKVRAVLVAGAVDIAKEYYLGITLDRQRSQNVIMASTEGGVEIEEVAARSPEKILKVWVDPTIGLRPFQARQLAFGLGFEGNAFKQAVQFIQALYRAYEETDSSLAEINPLVLTKQGDVVAVDAKINLDDNALFRHPDLAELRDIHEEDPLEVEASKYRLNYVRLTGNVGCMVNGAGLAMATMDLIKLAGGEPANFLDVGGGASPETVEAGFRIILKDPNVKVILVNIFGGIVRCDRVARGIVEAARKVQINVPLIVRLQGTNAEEARAILEQSGLEIETATLFKEVADKVNQALQRVAAA